MKNLFYLFVFLFVNSIYSQAPCGAGYGFTFGVYSGCTYWFKPTYPGTPTVDHITWRISSHGASGSACDTASHFHIDTAFYSFCFSDSIDVTMVIHFSNGSSCSVTRTVVVTCSGADICDPSPTRTAPITDPQIEITYIKPDTCDLNSGSQVQGCINQNNGMSNYYVVCGWQWAIRVPPGNFRCNSWTYYVQYEQITSCGNHTCVQTALVDTTFICIDAYIGQTIYVVATTASCCLPSGYQRGYYWTPIPSVDYVTICDPDPVVSVYCSAYRHCPDYTYCTENPQTMTQSSGWPGSCLTGGGKTQQRDYIKLSDNFNKEQDVIIYNIQGIEVFSGKWKFGASNNLNLNWPNGIEKGMYLIKFQNSPQKEIIKLFKF